MLVVDNFGVEVKSDKHAKHLIDAISEHYKLTVDWGGSLLCGITLSWDYPRHKVDLPRMPKYIPNALNTLHHPIPKHPQHAPYKHNPIVCGANQQVAAVDDSAPLTAQEIKYVQQAVGILLYHGCTVDPTLTAALSAIASRQAKGTDAVMLACKQLLDYVVMHPHATIASDMLLTVHSDASYLSEMNSKSWAGIHFYLSKHDNEDFKNKPVLTLLAIIKHEMASASEAKLAALFYNCSQAIPL